ncbi:unnamed protein product [Effrenium voratum]|nr:unnamed protein product [Effrenium voratum]
MSNIISAGTFGHPELCSKPCLFLHLCECPRASACNYCHREHVKPGRLSLHCRQDSKTLGEADLIALALPHLRAKNLAGTEEVISLLEQHLASLPQPARPDLAPKQIRTLNRQLKNLKFSQLVYLCPCSQLTHIQEAMSSLREQRAVEDLSMYEGYFSL